MNRPTYWAYAIGGFVAFFAVGSMLPHNIDESTLGFFEFAGLVYYWVIGAKRMDDTKHSQAWAIFTPMLIGMIVIGCLKSKEKPDVLEGK